MLLDVVTKDTTNYSCTVRVVDSSDGTPETGAAYDTAGIDLWYRRPGATHTSITEATQTEDGAHSDGGFVHISDGYYRLDLPDAAVATGVDYVDVGGTITDMVIIGGRIRLTDFDLNTATQDVNTVQISGDSTAANNAESAFDGTGYAFTSCTMPTTTTVTNAVTANVTQWLGTACATPTTAGVPEVDITYVAGSAASGPTGGLDTNVIEWNGTAVGTPDAAGYPSVTVKVGTGTGELDIASGTVDADIVAINGSGEGAQFLSASARSMLPLTVNTGNVASTTTTAQFLGYTEITPNHFIGRKLFWYASGDALRFQGTSITDSDWDAVNFEIMLTFDQLTEAPSDGDLVIIV